MRYLLLLTLAACRAVTAKEEAQPPEEETPSKMMMTDETRPVFTSFQAASIVIGQPDFTSNTLASTSATSVHTAVGSAAFDGTHLWLPDMYAHRVLTYAAMPTTNGAAASSVLGQATDTESNAGATATRWYMPQSLHADGAKLVVAESGGHRVLLVDGVTLGSTRGCGADRFDSPASAVVVNGRLLVADRGNNRVLIWNSVPTSNTPADLVLGQTSFNACSANGATVRSATTLRDPTDVWTDGTRVLVADRGNNRVLVWSQWPTESGTAADVVIGQKDFAVARDNVTASVLMRPSAIAVSDGRLFVADAGHNRVVAWNTLPASNGVAADLVLGQSSFTRGAANDGNASPSAQTLAYPSGVAFASDALVVSDALNRRFLVFTPQ